MQAHPPKVILADDKPAYGIVYGWPRNMSCPCPRFVWQPDQLAGDPSYTFPISRFIDQNYRVERKVGTKLWLFDCLTCDKCVPVCPNDANFTYVLPKLEIPVVRLHALEEGGYHREELPPLVLAEKHQIATYADLCNECGNCDVFCPEDGGPYILKPRFFGSEESFLRFAKHDGVHVARLRPGRFRDCSDEANPAMY